MKRIRTVYSLWSAFLRSSHNAHLNPDIPKLPRTSSHHCTINFPKHRRQSPRDNRSVFISVSLSFGYSEPRLHATTYLFSSKSIYAFESSCTSLPSLYDTPLLINVRHFLPHSHPRFCSTPLAVRRPLRSRCTHPPTMNTFEHTIPALTSFNCA